MTALTNEFQISYIEFCERINYCNDRVLHEKIAAHVKKLEFEKSDGTRVANYWFKNKIAGIELEYNLLKAEAFIKFQRAAEKQRIAIDQTTSTDDCESPDVGLVTELDSMETKAKALFKDIPGLPKELAPKESRPKSWRRQICSVSLKLFFLALFLLPHATAIIDRIRLPSSPANGPYLHFLQETEFYLIELVDMYRMFRVINFLYEELSEFLQ